MAKNARLNEVQSYLKCILHMMERQDAEYAHNRVANLERLVRLETSIHTLQSSLGASPIESPPPSLTSFSV